MISQTNLITTGLGAGSYPEEAKLPEGGAECCLCGGVRQLRERDGHVFCSSCEDEYLFVTSDQEMQMKYIRSSYSIERDFLLNHWWEELDEPAKMVIVAEAFDKRYKATNYATPEARLMMDREKRVIISSFIRNDISSFSDFLKSQEAAYV